MGSITKIPLFPLSIFPLPGELVPLHIFEPRYRQLLEDAEKRDFTFGIFFNHVSNTNKLGSLVKLESVIKRYASGESDIIVRCIDLFTMEKMLRNYRDKLYPGGEIVLWNADLGRAVSESLQGAFDLYVSLLHLNHAQPVTTLYGVANELNLGVDERLKFVQLEDERKESYLGSHLKYQIQLLQQAERAKDVFHLN